MFTQCRRCRFHPSARVFGAISADIVIRKCYNEVQAWQELTWQGGLRNWLARAVNKPSLLAELLAQRLANKRTKKQNGKRAKKETEWHTSENVGKRHTSEKLHASEGIKKGGAIT